MAFDLNIPIKFNNEAIRSLEAIISNLKTFSITKHHINRNNIALLIWVKVYIETYDKRMKEENSRKFMKSNTY